MTSAPYISPTATSIVTDIDREYKYTKADKALSAVIASQIAFTNAQAGIEHIGGKKYGIKNIESLVQAARASKNQYAKWDDAMAEINSYLETHTRADTVRYADERGINISEKDRKLAKKEVRHKARSVDKNTSKRYNRNSFKFLHKNFPSETESMSEAHRLAVWWARITKSEFETIYKEIKRNGNIGQIKSILAAPNGYDSVDRQHNSIEKGKSSADSLETQYRRESPEMVRVASSENNWRERSASDRGGNSQSGSENKQESAGIIRHKSRTTVTSGQYAQMKANLSHSKVYSKKSAMELVSKIAPGIKNSLSETCLERCPVWSTLPICILRRLAEAFIQVEICVLTISSKNATM